MKASQLVLHSLRTLKRFPQRSGFIMLSSVLGAAALTFVLSVGEGARQKMLTTVRQIFGDNSIVIGAGGHRFMGGPRSDAARLTIDDVEAAVRALPQVESWDPQQELTTSVRHGSAAATVRVLGQSERSVTVWGRGAARGVYFDAHAVQQLARVAVIGETAARQLFGTQDPVGAEIQIESVPFTVIGVLDRFGTDLHGMDRDNEIVVPISTLLRRVVNLDTIEAAKLQLRPGAPLAETTAQLRQLLRSRHALAASQPDDFALITPVEVQMMIGKIRRILSLYLPLGSMVVLLVGGVVAAALMLGSVNARVAEIGLRRAVGARPGQIALQFLTETAVTVFGGGVLGMLLGLAGAHLMAHHHHLTGTFSWSAIVVTLAVSAAVGLLAGVFPARRAARMLPVDALR